MIVAQQADHAFCQIVMHPRIAEIPETAIANLQRTAVTVELMGSFIPSLGSFIDDLELEPNSRDEPTGADGVGGGAQSCGENGVIDDPVAVLLDAGPRTQRPAIVNDEILDAGILEAVGQGDEVVVIGIPPSGTPLVENDWQRQFGLGSLADHGGTEVACDSVAGSIESAACDGEQGFGRGETFAGRERFGPVPEFAVGEAA